MECQINVLNEQILSARQSGEQYRERVKNLEGEIARRREDAEKYTREKKELDAGLSQAEAAQETAKKEFRDLAIEIHKLEEKIEEDKNEIIEILNMRASTKGKMQRYDAMMEQISLRKTELNQKLLRLKSEASQQKDAKERYETEQQEIEENIEKLTRQSNNSEDEIKRCQAQISKAGRELDIGQTAYHREASRL